MACESETTAAEPFDLELLLNACRYDDYSTENLIPTTPDDTRQIPASPTWSASDNDFSLFDTVSEVLPAEKIPPKINNVVTSIKTRVGGDAISVDLNLIFQKVKNAKYNPRRFPGIVLSSIDGGKTATRFIFANGTVTGFGASVNESLLHARQALHIIKAVLPEKFAGKKIELITKVSNICATGKIGYKVNIHALSLDTRYQKLADYEPDVFPGLIFRMLEPKTASIIYHSGIIKISAKSEEDIKTTMHLLETVVLPDFRAKEIPPQKSCYVEKTKSKLKGKLKKT